VIGGIPHQRKGGRGHDGEDVLDRNRCSMGRQRIPSAINKMNTTTNPVMTPRAMIEGMSRPNTVIPLMSGHRSMSLSLSIPTCCAASTKLLITPIRPASLLCHLHPTIDPCRRRLTFMR
jgi:hypothetical protein